MRVGRLLGVSSAEAFWGVLGCGLNQIALIALILRNPHIDRTSARVVDG